MKVAPIAETQPGNRVFWRVVRRLLLYVGLAFASLTVFALFFALTIRLGITKDVQHWFDAGWVGFSGLHWAAFLDHGERIETTLAPLEFLARDCVSVDDSFPCVRRHLTDISGLARDLVLARYRCRGRSLRWHAGVVVSGKARQSYGKYTALKGRAFRACRNRWKLKGTVIPSSPGTCCLLAQREKAGSATRHLIGFAAQMAWSE